MKWFYVNEMSWNLLVHPKRQHNIPQNQLSTHLNIAQAYVRKNDMILHARLSNLFNKMVRQMPILTEFGNLHFSFRKCFLTKKTIQ